MIWVIKSLFFHGDPDMTIEDIVNLESHYVDVNKKPIIGYNLTGGVSIVTALVSVCMCSLDQYKEFVRYKLQLKLYVYELFLRGNSSLSRHVLTFV